MRIYKGDPQHIESVLDNVLNILYDLEDWTDYENEAIGQSINILSKEGFYADPITGFI